MNRMLRTTLSLCLEILSWAMWLVLAAGLFIVSVGVLEDLPYSEANIAGAVLMVASIGVYARALFKMKRAVEREEPVAPFARDVLFACAVSLATTFGTLPA